MAAKPQMGNTARREQQVTTQGGAQMAQMAQVARVAQVVQIMRVAQMAQMVQAAQAELPTSINQPLQTTPQTLKIWTQYD